jgi:hypothetical protein
MLIVYGGGNVGVMLLFLGECQRRFESVLDQPV